MEADPTFTPPDTESRDAFGVRVSQDRDRVLLVPDMLRVVAGEPLPTAAVDDLLLGMAVARYAQSNSVCYVRDGMTLGVGAGQQSRVDCTRLAGAKTDVWWLRRHPAIRSLTFDTRVPRQEKVNWQMRVVEGDLTATERRRLAEVLKEPITNIGPAQRASWMQRLTGVAFASDGYLPFRDNIDHAHRHGVSYVAEPGGSIRSADVAGACREYGITLAHTGVRLFRH